MFGYVRAYKPELKMAEYETYKAVYCSLCRVLGRRYGIAARMTLSYDFTFMALLRLSTAPAFCGYSTMHCPFNPLKKCACLKDSGEELEFTAAVSVILFYRKLRDNLADKGVKDKLTALALLPFFARYRKKAAKKYPEIDRRAEEFMCDQARLEGERCADFDRAGEPTAEFLAFAFSCGAQDDTRRRVLAQMGQCAGRWVYLIDALDDLISDVRHGNYNVIAEKFGLRGDASEEEIARAREYAKGTVNLYNDGVCSAYSLLDTKRYGTIIGNVLYLGMKDTLNNLGEKKKADHGDNLSERNVK